MYDCVKFEEYINVMRSKMHSTKVSLLICLAVWGVWGQILAQAQEKDQTAKQESSLPATSSISTRSEEQLTPEATAAIGELRKALPEDSEAIAMLNDILKGSTLAPTMAGFRWQRPPRDSTGSMPRIDMIQTRMTGLNQASFQLAKRTLSD